MTLSRLTYLFIISFVVIACKNASDVKTEDAFTIELSPKKGRTKWEIHLK